jgi:hypothetical protein
VDLEVLFLPLDTPEDVKKLLSLELTGVFINEAREVPKAIIDAATSRVGRFPSKKDGVGPTWYGVIMDTNAPETEHWWPIMSGETPLPDHISEEQALMLVKPDNWKFFTQPAGMLEVRGEGNQLLGYEGNDLAENYMNLPPQYYKNMIRGKMKSWIDVYVLNRLGSTAEGKPVYDGFAEKTHVTLEPIPVAPTMIHVGIDFGLTPAAAFCQRLPSGRWIVVGELVCQDMGAKRFAQVLRRHCAEHFPDAVFSFFGDPTGDYRAGTDETTPFQIMRAAGVRVLPSPSNDPVVRVEAVNQVLMRMVDGDPGFLIHKKTCPVLVTGFLGGYHYRRLQTSGEKYEDKPNKNKFSHIHDGLQYAFLGGGEGRELLRGPKPLQAFVAKTGDSFHKRRARKRRMMN